MVYYHFPTKTAIHESGCLNKLIPCAGYTVICQFHSIMLRKPIWLAPHPKVCWLDHQSAGFDTEPMAETGLSKLQVSFCKATATGSYSIVTGQETPGFHGEMRQESHEWRHSKKNLLLWKMLNCGTIKVFGCCQGTG